MNNKVLAYDIKTEKIIFLNEKEKELYIQHVLEDLQSSTVNYVTQRLSEQEIYLFNIPESYNLSTDKMLFYTKISKLIEDIKKSQDYSYVQENIIALKYIEKDELELNYPIMCGIVNFIIYIFDNLPRKKREAILHDFSYKGALPRNMNCQINNINLVTLIQKASSIKTLNICLSNKKCQNAKVDNLKIDLKVVFLFCLFYKAFFINLLILNIDLNSYEINTYFKTEINPYKINTKRIVKIGNLYKNLFFANFILMKNMIKYEKFYKISIIMYDSYQLELHDLMSKYFSRNIYEINDINKKNNTSIENTNEINNSEEINFAENYQNKCLFFQHFLNLNRDFFVFSIDFNSLDPLIFSYVNILLLRYASLANISINFFDFNKVNYRKILINSYYYNNYSDKKKNPSVIKYSPEKTNTKYDNDYKIFYNYIISISENQNKELLLLREEPILKELFPYFNYHINTLLIILENKIKDETKPINSLSLNFTSSNVGYSNINSYNNYSTSIICFIFNLFYILETNKKCILAILNLFMDDIGGDKEFIIRNLQNKFLSNRESKAFNLKELKLSHLNLNIPNISIILPFENLPQKLTELILQNLSYRDFDNLIKAFKNKKITLQKLITLEIGLNLMIEDFRENLEFLLKECIPKDLNIFRLKIPMYITYEDIIDILTWIKKNKNNKATFFLKISHSKISPTIGGNNFIKAIKEFQNNYKKEFHKRNIITSFNCVDYKSCSLSMKMLNKDINYFMKFIYCFNKVYNKSGKKIENKNKNQKIFENIFYYMGKIRKANKEIRIEFI